MIAQVCATSEQSPGVITETQLVEPTRDVSINVPEPTSVIALTNNAPELSGTVPAMAVPADVVPEPFMPADVTPEPVEASALSELDPAKCSHLVKSKGKMRQCMGAIRSGGLCARHGG